MIKFWDISYLIDDSNENMGVEADEEGEDDSDSDEDMGGRVRKGKGEMKDGKVSVKQTAAESFFSDL